MKVLIASDIHGSLFYAEELERIIESEKPSIICS
jgi:predicted phosphodiesterase